MTLSLRHPIALLLLLLLLAASLLGHGRASAQTPEGVQRVLLLVVASDVPQSARRLEQAFQQALESRQLEVVVQREPEPEPGRPLASDTCISGGCLERRLVEAHAQLLVGLGAWLDREPPQVVLTLDDGHGPVNITERVISGETDQALAARMLDRAMHMFRSRAGVPMRVEGSPAGASVVIDHRPIGQLPVTAHLQPGPHDVTVAHVDYVTERRHVELGEEGAEVHIELTQEPEGASANSPGVEGQGEGRTIGTYLLSAGLAAAGVALSIGPLRTLAHDGQCQGTPDAAGLCDRADFDGGQVALLSIGGALLVAGAIVLAWGPFRATITPNHAELHVGLQF